jgi:hypothetical protein
MFRFVEVSMKMHPPKAGQESDPSASAVLSWSARQYTAKEEAEAQDAITMGAGIHDFLLH